MEIQSQLAAIRETVTRQLSPDLLTHLEQELQYLVQTASAGTLATGEMMPAFELPDQTGAKVSSQTILAQGPVVLSFKRGVWCPYCVTELDGLQVALSAIRELGAQVMIISPQVTRWNEKRADFPFPILRDRGNTIARQFGLSCQLPPEFRPICEHLGIRLAKYNGDNACELPIPATYIVNRQGRVVHRFVNPDYRQRPDPVEVVTQLRQLMV